MRLRSLTAPLALTLFTASLAIGCGEADKADDGGADGAADGSSADDGATDGGATDGNGEGATDGGGDGSADGTADGSADGAADGGGDGADDGAADGGEPVAEVVFEDDFESVRVDSSGYTSNGVGLDSWVLQGVSYSDYDEFGRYYTVAIGGGLYTDVGGELSSADPLPAPAGGQQCMYLNGYSSLTEASVVGYFSLQPDAVIIEAERSYTLDLALGRRTGFSGGLAQIYLWADLGGTNQVVAQADVYVTDLPEGGFAPIRLEIDPRDLLAGTSIGVGVQLYHAGVNGYTSFLVDNVTITATPAPAN